MMHTMRKNMKLILWIVIAAFVGTIFFVWGMDVGRQKDFTQRQSAAMVNDQPITFEEFDRIWTQQSQRLFGTSQAEPTREELQRLRRDLIEEMINMLLMRQQFEKLGFKIFPAEVAARIAAITAFQQDGKFSPEKYFYLLENNRIRPQEFESEQQRTLEIMKFQRWLKDTVLVSEDEARAYFQARSRELKLRLVTFNWKDRMKNISISEPAIQDYYRKRGRDFSQAAEVRASHILLTLDSKATEDQKRTVRLKMENLRKELLAGADFAKMAKDNSQDPGSAAKGGDLGFFKPGEMVPTFEKAAFGMKVGQISDIVESPFGLHLIRVAERKEAKNPSLAEVRGKIADILKEEQARKETLDQAVKFLAAVKKSRNVTAAAKETGAKWTDTPWLRLDSPLPGIDKPRGVMDQAFDLAAGKSSSAIQAGESQVFVEILAEKTGPFQESAFQNQRDGLMDALREKRSEAVLQSWLEQAKKSAKIINNIEKEQTEADANATGTAAPAAN